MQLWSKDQLQSELLQSAPASGMRVEMVRCSSRLSVSSCDHRENGSWLAKPRVDPIQLFAVCESQPAQLAQRAERPDVVHLENLSSVPARPARC